MVCFIYPFSGPFVLYLSIQLVLRLTIIIFSTYFLILPDDLTFKHLFQSTHARMCVLTCLLFASSYLAH